MKQNTKPLTARFPDGCCTSLACGDCGGFVSRITRVHTDSLSIGSNLKMIVGQTKPWQGRIDVICFLVQVGWGEGGVGGRIPKSSLRTGDGLRLRPAM